MYDLWWHYLFINQSGAKDFNPFLKKNDLEKGKALKWENFSSPLCPSFDYC